MFKTCIIKQNFKLSLETIVTLVFQFSVSDFNFVKPRLIKLILLVPKRRNPQALLVKILFIYF